MKKIVSLLMTAVILFGSVAAIADASEKPAPAIVVTGFGMVNMYVDYGTENEYAIWPLSIPKVLTEIATSPETLIPAAYKLIVDGDPSALGKRVSAGADELLPELYCNPDGTTIYNVSALPNDPKITNFAYLTGKGKAYASDSPFTNAFDLDLNQWLAEERGAENVFLFQYDFRMGAYDISSDLNKFVDAVLKHTGADKVDLFGLSYGGIITATYLTRFCTKGENKLRNVVLCVPALRGASIAEDFLTGHSDMPVDDVVSFIGSFLGLESNFSKYLEGKDFSELNGIASAFLKSVQSMPRNWGSMWDMLPPDSYKELKDTMLDSKKNAEIIKKSNYIHDKVMPNYTTTFAKCRKLGANISIICNTGSDTIFGDGVNADIMVHAASATGAKCATYGKRFADGYNQTGTVCRNKKHNHVSPSMEIDVSCGYLPENTWFIDGQFHSMYSFEEYSFGLVKKLLSAKKAINIYSDPNYPQFEVSRLPSYGVYAKFDKSASGFVSGNDTALLVTNIHTKYPIVITGITCNGMNLTFKDAKCTTILPGKTARIEIEGKLPQVSAVYSSVTVKFFAIGSPTPDSVRVFDMTIRNGKKVAARGGEAELTARPINDTFFKREFAC